MRLEKNNDNIRVVIRTRPTPNYATKNLSLDTMDNAISINVPKSEDKGIINNQKESWIFKFDKILHNVSQEEIFEYCAKEIIKKSIEGYNGTIFAYGQTGSGKTFTMSGSPNNYNYRGTIPRAITRVFQEIGNKPEFDFTIKVSYLEIYNETFFDLLSPIPSHEQKGDISIQEDSKGNLILKGLSKIPVNNEEEAFNLLFEGEANRTISEHQLNKESSRSHCIFTIFLEMKSRIESSEKVITSKLNFVDLAGSERVKKTGSTGITLKEANYINKSLTFLEQVVISLTEKSKNKKSKEHIPYRQSKLTHLLKDSVGGNCRTVMVATIMPEENHLHETLSSLNFARRMMSVVNEASVNIQLDTNVLLKNYAKEIKELKQELAMHNTLTNRGRINYDPYSPDEQFALQIEAKNFLTGNHEEVEFDSVRMAKELFAQCRILYQKLRFNQKDSISQHDNDVKSPSQKNLIQTAKKSSTQDDGGIGDLEIKPSFSIGKAPKDARPINKLEISREGNFPHSDGEEEKKDNINILKESEMKQVDENKQEYDDIPDKDTAYKIFKTESNQAKEIDYNLKKNMEDKKIKREQAKEYKRNCNELRSKIDDLRVKLNEKKLNKFNLGDELTNIIDEEECKFISDLKDVKENYKEQLNLFKEAKSDKEYIDTNIEELKLGLVQKFESWFSKRYGIRIDEYELRMNKSRFGIPTEEEMDKELNYDPEEMAYFNAKKKIANIHKAKRMEKNKK